MKKLLFLLFLPLFAHAQWQTAGQMQISRDTFNVRASLGKYGYIHVPKFLQVDSMFQNIPTQSVTDISHLPVNTQLLHNFSIANSVKLDSTLFVKSGPDSIITLRSNITLDTVRSGVVPKRDSDMVRLKDIKASLTTNLFGQNTSQANVGTYANSGADNTFTVGAWLNSLSGAGNVIVQVTWTDGHSVTHTKTFYESGDPSGTTYGGTSISYSFSDRTIRVKDGTNIVVSTTLSGSLLYEVGCKMIKVIGNGGL